MINTGILLTNIGTPVSPTPAAVKKYLRRFLADRRVVDIPPLIWQPILNGLILPFRSKSSAHLYQKIWMENGSPLLVYSMRLKEKLQQQLNLPVALGMHYSEPSIKQALAELKSCQKIIIVPLFPQYSSAATGGTFDLVMDEFKLWRNVPEIHFMHDYADHVAYIEAMANQINNYSVQYLLFSFHGITQRSTDKGDPYYERCLITAQLIAAKLNLQPQQWSVSFQSRLGKAKWLEPYTDYILKYLPKRGITNISVVCPGFAVDCLETLEEIAIRGKDAFIEAGGKQFHYIPALNDSDAHINALQKIIFDAVDYKMQKMHF